MSDVPQSPQRSTAEKLAVRVPFVWLLVFVLLPLVVVLRISLSPSPSDGWHGVTALFAGLSLDSYARLGSDPLYLLSFVESLGIAAFSTLILLIIAYPIAFAITRTPRHIQAVLMTFVMLPFWTAPVIRAYGWMNLLQPDGPLSRLLLALHVASEPPALLPSDAAVFIGIVYSYLPLMVLPLYAALAKIDDTLLDAAADLGCPPGKIFWEVTLPLSAPGVLAGALLCFIPAVGEFVIPDLLGSPQMPMIGQTIWAEFFGAKNWPAAAAVAVALVCLLLMPLVIVQHQATRTAERG